MLYLTVINTAFMFREEQTYVLFKDANTNSIFTMRHSVVLIVMFVCDKQN